MLLSLKFVEIDYCFKILLSEENLGKNIQEIRAFVILLNQKYRLNIQFFHASKILGNKKNRSLN